MLPFSFTGFGLRRSASHERARRVHGRKGCYGFGTWRPPRTRSASRLGDMSFNLGTVLIGTAFVASVYLLLTRSDRVFPLIAVIAAGVELLLVAHVMSLSIS